MAASQQVSWQYTINATSPLFNYEPFGDGNYKNGWAVWYDQTGFNPGCGQQGGSTAYRLTAAAGSWFGFKFRGTALDLYGAVGAGAAFSVLLDSQPRTTNRSSQNFFHIDGLDQDEHYVNVTVAGASPTDLFKFQRAVITSQVAQQPQLTTIRSTSNLVNLSGNWSTVSISAEAQPYMKTSTQNSGMSLNFTGANAISVTSPINCGHGHYAVDIDGSRQGTYYAGTQWLLPDTLLFFTDNLDPTVHHTITVTDIDPNDFSMGSFTLYATSQNTGTPSLVNSSSGNENGPGATSDAQPSPTNNQLPLILGVVISVIVLLILLVTAGVCIVRRRHQRVRVVPLSSRASSVRDYEASVKITPLLLDAQPTPTPGPTPRSLRFPGQGSEPAMSYAPSMSTENGGATPGQRMRDAKARQNGWSGDRHAPDWRDSAALPGPPGPRSEMSEAMPEPVAIERVLAMLAERIDQAVPMPPRSGNEPPPDYATMSRGAHF